MTTKKMVREQFTITSDGMESRSKILGISFGAAADKFLLARAGAFFDSLDILVESPDEQKAKAATIQYILNDLLGGFDFNVMPDWDVLVLYKIEASRYYSGYLDGVSGAYLDGLDS